MTVLARAPASVRLIGFADTGEQVGERYAAHFNDDLSTTADVAGAARKRLIGNQGIASMGFALHGADFLLDPVEAEPFVPITAGVLRPILAGKDLTQRPRNRWVIDFGYMTEAEARRYPVLFEIVRDRVKPGRDANARDSLRLNWW